MAWLAGLCLRQRWEVSTGMAAVDGVLISLRDSSVRQAQQAFRLNIQFLALAMARFQQAYPIQD